MTLHWGGGGATIGVLGVSSTMLTFKESSPGILHFYPELFTLIEPDGSTQARSKDCLHTRANSLGSEGCESKDETALASNILP